MQVKSYVGTNTQEILAQIKMEMGPDAIILSNRDFRKEGKRWHEVTAGIDRPVGVFDSVASSGRRNALVAMAEAAGAAPSGITSGFSGVGGGGSVGAGLGSGLSASLAYEEWQKDWRQIREHIYTLMQPSIQWQRLSPRQRVALEFMRREGVEGWVIMELYQRLAASPGASVLEALGQVTPTRPWGSEEWPERMHVMAGPSGSGKTTAALRMAMLLRQENPNRRIAFINVDCERGNGRLVLRHLAALSDFIYLEAGDAATMAEALRGAAEADTIFVDLPGLGRGKTLSETLTQIGLVGHGAAVHLVLPPHYGGGQVQAFLDRYQTGFPGSAIWTKLDEAAGAGTLINLSAVCGLPVSALSYGSGLRGTLVPAHEPLVWRLVFKGQLPGDRSPQDPPV